MAYRSYGSYGSFQRQPQQNSYRRILESNREQKQDFQVNENRIAQQQQSYLEVMRQKIRDEQANRDRNFQLEMEFKEDYQEAVERNARQEIANTKIKGESSEKFWSAISDFSNTAATKYSEYWIEQENKKNLSDFYKALGEIEQMDPEDRNLLFGLKQAEENESMVRYASANATANEVAANSNETQAKPIRDMGSGYKQAIWQKAKAAYAARNLPLYFNQNLDTVFTVQDANGEDLQLTFQQIKDRGDPLLVDQATTQMKYRVANMAGVDQLDPVWAAKNFYGPADQYILIYEREIALDRSNRDKDQQEASQDRLLNEEVQVALTSIGQPGSEFSFNSIITRIAAERDPRFLRADGTMDMKYIRDEEVLPAIGVQIQTGQYDDQLDSIKPWLNSQVFTFNGGQVSTLGETSSPAYGDLLKKIDARIEQRERAVEANEVDQMQSEIQELLAGAELNDGTLDPTEMIRIQRWARKNYAENPNLKKQALDILGQYDTYAEEKEDRALEYQQLVNLAQSGELTALDIQQNSGWLTTDQEKELNTFIIPYQTAEEAKDGGFNRKAFVKQVRELYRKQAKFNDVGKSNDPSIDLAAIAQGKKFDLRVQELLQDPSVPREQIFFQATKDQLVQFRKDIIDPDSDFYLVDSSKGGTNAYVQGYSLGNLTANQRQNYDQIKREVIADPSLLKENVYLGNNVAQSLKTQVKNGQKVSYTQWIVDIAKATNKQPFEVLNDQFEAFGYDERIKPGAFDKLIEVSKPNPYLDNLLKKPTQIGINTAIISTGNAVSTVRKGQQGMQDVQSLATLAQFKAPPLAAAMWALETGRGQTVHGPNALFNITSNDGQGTRRVVREFINGQWVMMPQTFKNYASPLESVKDLKAWADKAPGFNEAGTYREAIQAIYDAGYATSPSYVQSIVDILKGMGVNPDAPIYQHNGPVSNDPTYMTPAMQQVFYETGDIMAGMAPSQHVDVKQADNPKTPDVNEALAFFPETALDDYVVVEDPQFGDTSLSGLAKSFYGPGGRPYNTTFYAPRAYRNGTHLGWDYPTANGTKLRLKGGARVVGGYDTEFGYKAIIELPDGKRFSFLHGYKPQ